VKWCKSGCTKNNFICNASSSLPTRAKAIILILQNKRVIILGGLSGIGLAIAEQASSQGVDVVIVSRTGASRGFGAGIAIGVAEQSAAAVVNYSSSKESADTKSRLTRVPSASNEG
jgi:NAD(P)-dependent dehydrogenase (short-subunit alcohol dehydrogenase family)